MSRRKPKLDVTIEDVKKAEENYLNTIYIFRTLSELFDRNQVNHEIEHDVMKCTDEPPVTPDFLIFLNGKITDVIEHKSSLNVSYGKEILEEIIEKYNCLKYNDIEYHPQIICLIPLRSLKIMEEIRNKENIKIWLAGFDIDYDVRKITFEIHDKLQNKKIEEILNMVIPFDPIEYSEYRFIKAEPKYPTYTALTLWVNVLLSLQDPYIGKNNFFEVDFKMVSKRARNFFPEWIRNNEQLTNNRIKRGLEFLKKIGFIKWDGRKDPIVVYYTKGTKVGDLREYFAKKFVELYGEKKIKKEKGKILTLDYFSREKSSSR
ncbi:MAG: hypothetical protein FE045_03320 [Thermoplasmata archaeon]|nr:MAG: hypothetical protein FE045_03320 [Thermoplasmata archaeon]